MDGVDGVDCVSGVSKTVLDCIFCFFWWEIYLLWLVQVGELSGGVWWMGNEGDGVGSSLESSKVLTSCVFRPHNFIEVRIHRWLRTCINCKSRVKG